MTTEEIENRIRKEEIAKKKFKRLSNAALTEVQLYFK